MLLVAAGGELEGMGGFGLDDVSRRDRPGQGGRRVERHCGEVPGRRCDGQGQREDGQRHERRQRSLALGTNEARRRIDDMDIPLARPFGRCAGHSTDVELTTDVGRSPGTAPQERPRRRYAATMARSTRIFDRAVE